MRHPHYRPGGFCFTDFFFACLALSSSVTILNCASRSSLRFCASCRSSSGVGGIQSRNFGLVRSKNALESSLCTAFFPFLALTTFRPQPDKKRPAVDQRIPIADWYQPFSSRGESDQHLWGHLRSSRRYQIRLPQSRLWQISEAAIRRAGSKPKSGYSQCAKHICDWNVSFAIVAILALGRSARPGQEGH
jgi:hypothetical protein